MVCTAALAASVLACGTSADAQPATPSEIVSAYTRFGGGPNDTDVELTYTPPAFYRALGEDPPAEIRARDTLAFLFGERVHDGELPPPATVALIGPRGEQVSPSRVTVVTDGGHHRTTRLLFPIVPGALSEVTLVVLGGDGVPAPGAYTWAVADGRSAQSSRTAETAGQQARVDR